MFREGKGGRKRGRETSMGSCLSCALHHWGPGPQPRHVPWLEIEPGSLWFAVRHSAHWATPARDGYILKLEVTELTYRWVVCVRERNQEWPQLGRGQTSATTVWVAVPFPEKSNTERSRFGGENKNYFPGYIFRGLQHIKMQMSSRHFSMIPEFRKEVWVEIET